MLTHLQIPLFSIVLLSSSLTVYFPFGSITNDFNRVRIPTAKAAQKTRNRRNTQKTSLRTQIIDTTTGPIDLCNRIHRNARKYSICSNCNKGCANIDNMTSFQICASIIFKVKESKPRHQRPNSKESVEKRVFGISYQV